MTSRKSFAIGTVSVLLVIAAWDTLSLTGAIDREIFPAITLVVARAFQLLTTDFLSRDAAASFMRLATAAAIVFPPAIFLGVLCGTSSGLRAAISPFFNFTYPLPKVAVFPLVLVLFGLGDGGKIALIALGLFYPLFLNVMNGVRRIEQSALRDVTRVYGLKGAELYGSFYLRGVLPDAITGLKASIAYGFTLVVVSEITASNNGLGNFIWRSWDAYRLLDMDAGIFVLCFIGWAFQALLDLALRRTGFDA